MITLPYPENPQHIDNLSSIDLLKHQGFEGMDTDLAISLFEYGLVWRDLGDEFLFVYTHPNKQGSFDRATFPKTLDVRKEFNWVAWNDLMNYLGSELSDWIQLPLSHKIYDLMNYYGVENVFGSSYWEGFTVKE